MIVLDFSKQHADSKEIQNKNFNGSFDRAGNATRFSFFKNGKYFIWIFHEELLELCESF